MITGSRPHPANSSAFSSAVPPRSLTPAPTRSALLPVSPLVSLLATRSATESPTLPYVFFASPAPGNISSVPTSFAAWSTAYALSSFSVAPSFSACPLVVPYVRTAIDARDPAVPVPVRAPTRASVAMPVPDSTAPYHAFSNPFAFLVRSSHSACLLSCFSARSLLSSCACLIDFCLSPSTFAMPTVSSSLIPILDALALVQFLFDLAISSTSARVLPYPVSVSCTPFEAALPVFFATSALL